MQKPIVTLRDAINAHAGETCQLPNCSRQRYGVSRWCTYHLRKQMYYGHPLGLAIPRDLYITELHEVRQLFNDNPDHPALRNLCKWFDQWIEEAANDQAVCGNWMFKRIHTKRIQGKEGLDTLSLLVELAALYVFSQRYPQRLPDDARLTWALSRNLIRLSGMPKTTGKNSVGTKQPPQRDLKEGGERIRQTLSAFFANVHSSLIRKAEAAKEYKDNMSLPFA